MSDTRGNRRKPTFSTVCGPIVGFSPIAVARLIHRTGRDRSVCRTNEVSRYPDDAPCYVPSALDPVQKWSGLAYPDPSTHWTTPTALVEAQRTIPSRHWTTSRAQRTIPSRHWTTSQGQRTDPGWPATAGATRTDCISRWRTRIDAPIASFDAAVTRCRGTCRRIVPRAVRCRRRSRTRRG